MNLELLKKCLLNSVNLIKNNEELINNLNVFPVPDGDTGSNMLSTIDGAFKNIQNNSYDSLYSMLYDFSKGSLMHARGNSGVILSQFFKGFELVMKNFDDSTISIDQLLLILNCSKNKAYESVSEPVEGTMLTVIREVSEKMHKIKSSIIDHLDFFQKAYTFAEESCNNTPNILPILKQSNVVDSGGKGIVFILKGFYLTLKGEEVVVDLKSNQESKFNRLPFSDMQENFDGEFGFCTEFIVNLNKVESFSKKEFQIEIEPLCESIVLIQDDDLLKGHVHTQFPIDIFNIAKNWGEIIKIKADNMETQSKSFFKKNEEKKRLIEIISCNMGEGIIEQMKKFGIKHFVSSSQTNNPSYNDFVNVINQIQAKEIIILPNNSNVFILAQKIAKDFKEEKNILVLKTRNQLEGIIASTHFDMFNSLEKNLEEMQESINDIKVVQVTKAIRDSQNDMISIKKGHFISIYKKKILNCNEDLLDNIKDLFLKMIQNETEYISFYIQKDFSLEIKENITKLLKNDYPEIEFDFIFGGQPIYNLLISFE